jgi:membrane-associated protease RseP (regulator of RpoE activity)
MQERQQREELRGERKGKLNAAERKRLEERRRRLEEELKRLNRQLEEDQAALRRELERLNARLPLASGARRIGIGFSPAIADVIASAKSLSGLALDGVKTAPSLDLWTGRPAGGATYAIPASRAKIAVAQIREHGRVAHAFLGVQTTDLTSADRERLKAPAEARVRIVNVSPDSPARDAGLRKDDVLLEIAGKNVESAADLVDLMARHRPGERITVQIWRDGERKSIDVTLRERPRQTLFVPPRFTVPRVEPFIVRPRVDGQQNTLRSFVRVSPEGRVAASAAGTGKSAKITLDAQDAVLEGVLRELSRATELRFTAEGDAARKRITLKVENVSVDDLVDSMSRLFHLRVERRDNTITFRSR